MKKIFIILLVLNFTFAVYGDTFQGGVSERGNGNSSRIIDKKTGKGIDGAVITLPKQHYRTKTDREGYFELDTSITNNSIMSVQKNKYKPFSMTINDSTFSAPIVIGIEKSNANDVVIDSNMHHLGDNSYSNLSANAKEFQSQASGPFYTQKVMLKNINFSHPVYLQVLHHLEWLSLLE